MVRSQWGSRIGFILASVGSAVGLGAVWKFPYVTATNGGGVFLLAYLGFSLSLGLGLMVTEWALGRAAHAGPVGVFKQLARRHRGAPAWALTGYTAVFVCFLILCFYCVVGGWTVAYFLKAVGGLIGVGAVEGSSNSFLSTDTVQLTTAYEEFAGHPVWPVLAFAAFTGMTLWVILGGVRKGIEVLSKYLMPALFVLMLVLIARGLTLPGATKGLLYFLQPDFSKLTGPMLVDAMGLSFFSLSLGMGIMVTYGSYVPDDTRLVKSSIWVISLAVMTSFLAGLMVLPPMFAFGFSPLEGPRLTMVTMPAVFAHLPAGGIFAVAFFFLLLVAALTSSVSILEVLVSFWIDEFGWSRRKAAWITTIAFSIPGIAVSWSMGKGLLSGYQLFGKNLFGMLDYATSNLLMPLTEMALALFAGWVVWPVIEQQLSMPGVDGTNAAMEKKRPIGYAVMRVFLRYIAPAGIVVAMISAL